MDRKELTALISKGPIRVTMNDGQSYEILSSELATVSDIAASVLVRADDGKFRHIYLPLVTMCAVEPMTEV